MSDDRKPIRRPRGPTTSPVNPLREPVPSSEAPEELHIKLEHLARAQWERGQRRAEQRQRVNPFQAPPLAPGVKKPGGGILLAQDENINSYFNWAQSSLAGAFEEGQAWLGFAYLSELAQRPEYRTLSEVIGAEATREWIELKSVGEEDKSDKIRELDDALKEYEVRDRFKTMSDYDGFMGRSHLYIDTGDTDDPSELKTPLGDGRSALSKLKLRRKGHALLRFHPVEAVWVWPLIYESVDPLRVDWFRPRTWQVMSKEVHESRILPFISRPVPDLLKPAYSFGGLSMSQMAKPYVDNWIRTRQAVSDLIHSYVVFVLKTNMTGWLQNAGEQLFRRAQLFNEMRDNNNLFLLDKDQEDFQNISAPLGGLHELQGQAQEHMAAVSRIPIVKLLGIQPAGLNASSEGELRSFEDWIHAYQEFFFRPRLKVCIDFVMLQLWGKVDPDITFVFKPLQQLTGREQAEIQHVKAQARMTDIEAGVIQPEEGRKAVANDPDSQYSGLDLSEMPPTPEQGQPPGPGPEEGMEGGGGPQGPGAESTLPAVGKPGLAGAGVNQIPSRGENAGGTGPGDPSEELFSGGLDLAYDAAEWKEADHPRGQPGNKGQFGPGGGSSGSGKKVVAPKSLNLKIGGQNYTVQIADGKPISVTEHMNIGGGKSEAKLLWTPRTEPTTSYYERVIQHAREEFPGEFAAPQLPNISRISSLSDIELKNANREVDEYAYHLLNNRDYDIEKLKTVGALHSEIRAEFSRREEAKKQEAIEARQSQPVGDPKGVASSSLEWGTIRGMGSGSKSEPLEPLYYAVPHGTQGIIDSARSSGYSDVTIKNVLGALKHQGHYARSEVGERGELQDIAEGQRGKAEQSLLFAIGLQQARSPGIEDKTYYRKGTFSNQPAVSTTRNSAGAMMPLDAPGKFASIGWDTKRSGKDLLAEGYLPFGETYTQGYPEEDETLWIKFPESARSLTQAQDEEEDDDSIVDLAEDDFKDKYGVEFDHDPRIPPQSVLPRIDQAATVLDYLNEGFGLKPGYVNLHKIVLQRPQSVEGCLGDYANGVVNLSVDLGNGLAPLQAGQNKQASGEFMSVLRHEIGHAWQASFEKLSGINLQELFTQIQEEKDEE